MTEQPRTPSTSRKAIAGLAVAGAIAVGGVASAITAYADPSASPTASPSASSSATPGSAATPGQQGPDGERRGGGPRGAGHAHTAVTGDELAKVTAAVKAKDSAVTVTTVQKDPDGSYDITGTKAGDQVRYEASADLKTITEGKGGRGGGKGGGPRGQHTAATADETSKVTAAVKAKDSAVTVDRVLKDADGSFDVVATKAGEKVFYEVSSDLKTITERTGGPKGHRWH